MNMHCDGARGWYESSALASLTSLPGGKIQSGRSKNPPLSNQESARGHGWIASPSLEGGAATQSLSDLSMR